MKQSKYTAQSQDYFFGATRDKMLSRLKKSVGDLAGVMIPDARVLEYQAKQLEQKEKMVKWEIPQYTERAKTEMDQWIRDMMLIPPAWGQLEQKTIARAKIAPLPPDWKVPPIKFHEEQVEPVAVEEKPVDDWYARAMADIRLDTETE